MSNFGPNQKAEHLLSAVEHRSLQELDRFAHLLLQLGARKLAASISPREEWWAACDKAGTFCQSCSAS